MNARFIRNWIGFFILGTINNLFYVIVNSSALVLASSFGVPNLVAVVPWANIGLSVFIKILNTLLLIRLPYGIRFGSNALIMLGGILGISFAPTFYSTIIFILMTGFTCAFGENVALEYLQKFDSRLINAWSSGTGLAALLGGTLYIFFSCLGFESTTNNLGIDNIQRMRYMDKVTFLCSTSLPFLYLIAYFIIIKKPKEISVHNSDEITESHSDNDSHQARTSNTQDQYNKCLTHELGNDENQITKRSKYLATYWKGFCATLWISLNLTGVYLFEYQIRTFTAKSRPRYDFHPACPELYSALQLSYQLGVFVSRSSLQLVKIKRVEVLTVLQAINMLLWFVNIFFKFLPLYLLPLLMVYVGILGGAAYVNVFYRIKTEHKYQFNPQVCINICSSWIAVGIFSATATNTILNITFLKDY